MVHLQYDDRDSNERGEAAAAGRVTGRVAEAPWSA
jgi:hypothetical protein